MLQLSFQHHRFPPEIIRHSIWLYARFTLSFRDVEEPAIKALTNSTALAQYRPIVENSAFVRLWDISSVAIVSVGRSR